MKLDIQRSAFSFHARDFELFISFTSVVCQVLHLKLCFRTLHHAYVCKVQTTIQTETEITFFCHTGYKMQPVKIRSCSRVKFELLSIFHFYNKLLERASKLITSFLFQQKQIDCKSNLTDEFFLLGDRAHRKGTLVHKSVLRSMLVRPRPARPTSPKGELTRSSNLQHLQASPLPSPS